jgi:ribonuclease P protein component
MPAEEQEIGPMVGFTVSRAMGNSVVRNRMRRRMREAVRLHLGEIGMKWRIVFNPRRPILTVASDALEREVGRLVAQCKNS